MKECPLGRINCDGCPSATTAGCCHPINDTVQTILPDIISPSLWFYNGKLYIHKNNMPYDVTEQVAEAISKYITRNNNYDKH